MTALRKADRKKMSGYQDTGGNGMKELRGYQGTAGGRMKELGGHIKGEVWKMRHTLLPWMHVLIPLIGIGIFLQIGRAHV